MRCLTFNDEKKQNKKKTAVILYPILCCRQDVQMYCIVSFHIFVTCIVIETKIYNRFMPYKWFVWAQHDRIRSQC